MSQDKKDLHNLFKELQICITLQFNLYLQDLTKWYIIYRIREEMIISKINLFYLFYILVFVFKKKLL